MFIALLYFSGSLATKFVPLNNESFITRPTVISLIPIKLNYLLIISLHRCDESWNSLDDSSAKLYLPNKAKDGNVKYLI